MRKDESRTDLGTIRIHKNVIASVASIAAAEIDGVKRIGWDLKSGLMEIILGKRPFTAIKVDINRNEEVKVEIPIIIKYGYNIPDIASKVQENVRSHLEKMTNLLVKDIDINVQGIERG